MVYGRGGGRGAVLLSHGAVKNLDALQHGSGLLLPRPWPGVTNTFSAWSSKCGRPAHSCPTLSRAGNIVSRYTSAHAEGWNAASRVPGSQHGALYRAGLRLGTAARADGQARANGCVSSR